jgi:hypothetical protein
MACCRLHNFPGKKMDQALKLAAKIILILIGGVMLFGGGICVATNIMFAAPRLFHADIFTYLILMGISALVAWLGYKLIVSARSINNTKS